MSDFYTKEHIAAYIAERKLEISNNITRCFALGLPRPRLMIVQVGDNPASNTYVKGKISDCNETGIESYLMKLPENITYDALVSMLSVEAPLYDGVIIQLPLPTHLQERFDDIIKYIKPEQDVDGFRKDTKFEPCTPLGICNYLEHCHSKEWFSGKHAVIVGRSDLVGRPLSRMLLDRDCTVTVAHSKTKNLRHVTSQADILVSATGVMNLINRFNIKPDVAAVINVGFAFNENGKMKGDVDVEDVMRITQNCMPIVGSTGVLTRLSLLENTYHAYSDYWNKKLEQESP